MNEPLVCWISLLVVLLWGSLTQGKGYHTSLKEKCGCLAPVIQWYVVAGFFLFLFFMRTLWDVLRFEYLAMKFLNPDKYMDNLNPDISYIGLSDDELNGPALTIPTFLRWLSLVSPIAGLITFVVASCQTVRGIIQHNSAEKRSNAFLRTVVIGMPLVFVAMAVRATIREWAVMTGSCWSSAIKASMKDATPEVRQNEWESLKALEIATYEQDLQVAAAFQFFAVGCFGQVCSKALSHMVSNNNNAENRDDPDAERKAKKDSGILRQLAVVGLHAFVVLGVAKTVVNIVIAMISSDPANLPIIQPIQTKIIKTLDPVFLFATVLSVINMMLLGKMDEVSKRLPGANTKFNATRALLIIGQGQFSVIRAFITTGGDTPSPVLHALHNFKWHGEHPFADLTFDFGIHQARLLHSSLLCFECLIVAIVNFQVWKEHSKIESEEAGQLTEPLNP